VKFDFIATKEVAFPVDMMCRTLGVSRSGYYAWRNRPVSARGKADAQLVVDIAAAHRRSRGTYGSPRVHAELRARGRCVGRKRVERLMRDEGLRGRRRRRFCRTTDSAHSMPVAPNVLDRKFDIEAPNQAWVGDVTYIPTDEGWLFLAVLIDLFSRRVVGWATSATNDRALALAALQNATRSRCPSPGLLHHTDRGSPYASEEYRETLRGHAATPSMSRTSNCWDNAVAESFFATLKGEQVDHDHFVTRAAAAASVADYIEEFYNRTRRHSRLGYVSPVEFELRSEAARMAA
jgi:transposase InsO family protein